jgi:hypothetical protein
MCTKQCVGAGDAELAASVRPMADPRTVHPHYRHEAALCSCRVGMRAEAIDARVRMLRSAARRIPCRLSATGHLQSPSATCKVRLFAAPLASERACAAVSESARRIGSAAWCGVSVGARPERSPTRAGRERLSVPRPQPRPSMMST